MSVQAIRAPFLGWGKKGYHGDVGKGLRSNENKKCTRNGSEKCHQTQHAVIHGCFSRSDCRVLNDTTIINSNKHSNKHILKVIMLRTKKDFIL